MTAVWARIDAGKRARHCVVIDAAGRVLVSRRVANDESASLELIAAALAVAGEDPAGSITNSGRLPLSAERTFSANRINRNGLTPQP